MICFVGIPEPKIAKLLYLIYMRNEDIEHIFKKVMRIEETKARKKIEEFFV